MNQEALEEQYIKNNFAQHIQLKVVKSSGGVAIVKLETQDIHLNPNNQIHGGALFSLADNASGAVVMDENYMASTLNSDFHYLAPGKLGDTLTATATIIKNGRTIVVVSVDVKNQDDKLLCHGTFTYFKILRENLKK